MKRKTLLSFATVLALLSMPYAKAHAQIVPTQQVIGIKVSLGYRGFEFHYKEHCTPSDKDKAWLNGIELKIEHVKPEKGALGYSYWWLDGFYATANGKYYGYSQNGAGTYYKADTNTNESIERGETGVGFIQIGNRVVTKESILMGERWWFRKIKNGVDAAGNFVKGYEEDYGNMYIGLQFEVDYYFSPNFHAGLTLAGAFSPKIEAINQMYNKYLDETYKMGKAYYFKVRFPISYSTGRFSFDMVPFYNQWEFHRSNNVVLPDGTVTYEPSSTTKEYGVSVTLGFRF